jgi:hypothetical protein
MVNLHNLQIDYHDHHGKSHGTTFPESFKISCVWATIGEEEWREEGAEEGLDHSLSYPPPEE